MNNDLINDLQLAVQIRNVDLIKLLVKEINVDLSPKWVDSSGLRWYDALPGCYNFDTAKYLAQTLDLRLPTIEEFKQAEKEGIRTKFNDFKDCWFWSSSPHPYDAGFALFFNGFNGKVGNYVRNYDCFSVRCVSR